MALIVNVHNYAGTRGTVYTVTVTRDDERAAIAAIIRAVNNRPFVG